MKKDTVISNIIYVLKNIFRLNGWLTLRIIYNECNSDKHQIKFLNLH